jgi:NAD(P)-dependent dehydrogenase (short-subunit alcohol dehydrogenase family)
MTTNSFTGKTALIIGGTSGMGKATAKLLLSLGAKVIVASKSGKSVDAAVAELGKHGEVTGKVLNLTDDADVKRFVQEISEFDRIDYLVNASGIFRPKPFLDSTPEDYDAFLNINRGFFFVTQAVAKKQKANGGGAIVNIGSYWATHAVKGTPTTAYSMAKAGLQSFTQHIAMELAADKIRVNAIAPGVVETNVLDGVFGSHQAAQEAYKGLAGIHPLGRNGHVTEIASVIAYLLSDEAEWITGAVWAVDGGMAAGRS